MIEPLSLDQAKRRGGRPSRERASKISDTILDAAADLFFEDGYGAVSIEDIARAAQISKRTFYVRFENKAALFRAVVHRVIERVTPPEKITDQLFKGASLADVLHRIGPLILRASLSKDTLSLVRLVLSEANRFPELVRIMHEQSSRQEGVRRIAQLLAQDATFQKLGWVDANFAAEQFLFMLTGSPQRRALGFGAAMTSEQLTVWSHDTVELFLHGILPRPAVR